jgi:hypothetical protein
MTTGVLKRQVGVCLGKAERPIGQLTYIKDGAREYSSFAYDNPFPDKDRESNTWLSEDMGPVTSLIMLMERADYFCLQPAEALKSLFAVYGAVCDWRTVALGTDVGLRETELDDFAPAFEHPDMKVAQSLLA